MKIPPRISSLLRKDSKLESAVNLTISQFEPWINSSQLTFFPEYTDHGINHIENILSTISSMIKDNSWTTMQPGDGAVIILSALLHDSALHFSEDSFYSLLAYPRCIQTIEGMKDRPWNLLWEEFLNEASRFDGRKLMNMFGDTKPIQRPPSDQSQLTKRDRMLIGEFIRRYHARLAQEIAIFGIPSHQDDTISLIGFSSPIDHIPSISGLVARSHGQPIRSLFENLANRFDLREVRGVHAVFLMTLLRVSDYLQVESERAPAQILRVRKIISPFSEGEWTAHNAIRDIRQTHDDPEAIFIDALPLNAKTFIKIQSWLNGIQHEMDESWAALGEVYGRIDALNNLGLTLRRVRSSIDNVEEFSQKASYLPIQARFKAADSDLLKLLIEPLYGSRPEVGLRELIQNSVDAVREAKAHSVFSKSSNLLPFISQSADVEVSLQKNESGEYWIVICDKGIGMTPEIILNYFLTAGASFRKSEEWRNEFENSEGKSRILRAGRFGVGALAAFLLGPKIEVSTRHINSPSGITFSACVEDDIIELKKSALPIGTTIKITITQQLATLLHDGYIWDWYCSKSPSVGRSSYGKKLFQTYQVPSSNESPLPLPWRRIEHKDYQDIVWTHGSVAPRLTCNGLRVEHIFEGSSKWFKGTGILIPRISVWDPDGKLPLNLQRTELSTPQYPFHQELSDSVMNDFCAFSLTKAPLSKPKNLSFQNSTFSLNYIGSDIGYSRNTQKWFFTNKGTGLVDPYILSTSGFKSALLIRGQHAALFEIPFQIKNDQVVISIMSEGGVIASDKWLRSIIDVVAFRQTGDEEFPPSLQTISRLDPMGARILVGKDIRNRAVNGKIPQYFRRKVKSHTELGDYYLLEILNCPTSTFDFTSFTSIENNSDREDVILAEIYFGDILDEPSALALKWMSLFNEGIIPYNIESRKTKYLKSYDKLKHHLEYFRGGDEIVDEEE